jgi:hypothetical protein
MLDLRYQMNAPSCIGEAVEDDLIVINLISGRYYNMRHEAAVSWLALTQGVSPAELISSNAWSREQVLRFKAYVQYLLNEQLLILLTQDIKVPESPIIKISDSEESFHVDAFTDMEEMLILDPIHDASLDTGWPHKA